MKPYSLYILGALCVLSFSLERCLGTERSRGTSEFLVGEVDLTRLRRLSWRSAEGSGELSRCEGVESTWCTESGVTGPREAQVKDLFEALRLLRTWGRSKPVAEARQGEFQWVEGGNPGRSVRWAHAGGGGEGLRQGWIQSESGWHEVSPGLVLDIAHGIDELEQQRPLYSARNLSARGREAKTNALYLATEKKLARDFGDGTVLMRHDPVALTRWWRNLRSLAVDGRELADGTCGVEKTLLSLEADSVKASIHVCHSCPTSGVALRIDGTTSCIATGLDPSFFELNSLIEPALVRVGAKESLSSRCGDTVESISVSEVDGEALDRYFGRLQRLRGVMMPPSDADECELWVDGTAVLASGVEGEVPYIRRLEDGYQIAVEAAKLALLRFDADALKPATLISEEPVYLRAIKKGDKLFSVESVPISDRAHLARLTSMGPGRQPERIEALGLIFQSALGGRDKSYELQVGRAGEGCMVKPEGRNWQKATEQVCRLLLER